jgi:molecular chaperone GrpE
VAVILNDFRSWLSALPAEVVSLPAAPAAQPLDLHTLLGQFQALRHEVNLQTRATRAQQELNAEALRQLGEALEELHDAAARTPSEGPAAEDRLRPLLKTLVELHDLLALAAREWQRGQDAIKAPLQDVLTAIAPEADEPPELQPSPEAAVSGWRRWFGRHRAAEHAQRDYQDGMRAEQDRRRLRDLQRQEQVRLASERSQQMLSSLLAGYTMSLQRLERALRDNNLEPIRTVGQPFDPEQMEVVEAVSGSGRPSGEVLDELRRGYLWNGRLFRYALVRVAKS